MSAVGSAEVDSRTNGKFPLYLHELAQRHTEDRENTTKQSTMNTHQHPLRKITHTHPSPTHLTTCPGEPANGTKVIYDAPPLKQ